MVDKITTMSKAKLGTRVRLLDGTDILRLKQAILVFLAPAVSPRATRPT